MLYLVATPIGNLEDITLRALRILRSVDLILCEDTRHSGHLLRHYEVSARLSSYHKFNELEKEDEIVRQLKEGKTVALLSDAGTPLLEDPGERLVRRCYEEKIPVTALPGATASITALTLSSFSAEQFQFVGFLPKKASELKQKVEEMLDYSGTSICYESPHRIAKTLQLFSELAPGRRLCIARELTKTFEEVRIGTALELLSGLELRGEFVLLVERAEKESVASEFEEDCAYLQKKFPVSKRDAIRLIAELRNVSRRNVYQNSLKK